MSKLVFALFLSLAVCHPSTHWTAGASQSASSPEGAASYFKRLAGTWQGTLEYADYKDDKRVRLPTTLEVRPAGDGKTAEFLFTYDDFGKTVKDQDVHRIDQQTGKYKIDNDEYEVGGIDQFGKVGKLVLTGRGRENNEAVDVRETITLAGEVLTILRETRTPLRFRHEYVLRRAAAVGGEAK